MKNNKLKLIVAIVAVLPLLAWSNLALAWEGTYQLNTGISTTTVNGTVIVAPTASPIAGTYNSAQSVTLTANGSTSIHYTIDGSTPTCSTGTVYSGVISVSSSEVITAISCYKDNSSSTVYPSSVVPFGYAIVPVSTGGGGGGGAAATTPTTNNVWDSTNVGILDFSILMSEWGQTVVGLSADLNHDGTVDILDFSMLMANWNGQ